MEPHTDMDAVSKKLPQSLSLSLKTVLCFIMCVGFYAQADLDIGNLEQLKTIHLAKHYQVSLSSEIKTLDQALTSDSFKPALSVKKIPNFKGPIWLKLELENKSSSKKKLIWVDNYPRIQDIEFFVTDKNKVLKQYRVGEKYVFSERPLPYHLFALPFDIEPFQSLTIFIKPHTLGFNITHHSEIQSENYFLYDNKPFEFLHFFYFGILFVMGLYSFLIHLILKDRSYLCYCGFVGSSLLFYFSNSGYAFQYLWPDLPFLNQRIIYVAMALFFCFAGWFSISFLSLASRLPKISKAINLLCIGCLLYLLYFLPQTFDPNYTAVRLLSIFSLPIYTLCLIGGIMTWHRYQDRNAKTYTIAWSLLIIVSLLALVNESIYKFSALDVLTFLQITHGIEIFILSMALGIGISELKIKENLALAKAETQSRFFAKMSHEIRTPMNAILGIADVLKTQLTHKEDKYYAEVIYTNADSLGKIINDILDYSSIEAGKIKIIKKPFSLKIMTENLCALFELEIKSKALTFNLIIDPKTPNQFIGDHHRIQQILVNLISNAIKYTPKGEIRLEISAENDTLHFQIKDTGIGIAKEDQSRLFRPFEQMQNNHLSSEYSTGLGLAICLDLAKAMNGSLNVVSVPTKGSVFTLTLPLKSYTKATTPLENHDKKNHPLQYQSILVIEDNATNSLVIGAILEKFGLPFHVANDGAEGLAYFKKHARQVDLIFMDCEMPLMDGYESTKAIRYFEARQKLTKTPIIALTANTWPKQLERCYRVGMDDLLLKPITIKRVRNILDAYEPNTSTSPKEPIRLMSTSA